MMSEKKWTLIGLPDDEGVKNVGGRIGAAQGPKSFSEFYNKLKPKQLINQFLDSRIDRQLSFDSLPVKHDDAVKIISEQQAESEFSVIVGGGHDYIYCHLKGIADAYPDNKIGCINIDPHFDMRDPKPIFTSGSPFNAALSEGVIEGENLIEFGIQEHCNAPELWTFAEEHNVQVVPFRNLRGGKVKEEFEISLEKLEAGCDFIVVSFDLDSVAAPHAPGVSAPAAEGFTPTDVLEMLEISGKSEKVCSLGVYELNPLFDQDNITARLAAASVHYFALEKLKALNLIQDK